MFMILAKLRITSGGIYLQEALTGLDYANLQQNINNAPFCTTGGQVKATHRMRVGGSCSRYLNALDPIYHMDLVWLTSLG